jgi:hypothetical protein
MSQYDDDDYGKHWDDDEEPFAHRPGSACCDLNPSSVYLQASRAGASDDDLMEIAADLALNGKCKVLGKNNTVPF